MNIIIFPKKLAGTVLSVPSESEAHRKLICAALSAEKMPLSTVRNVPFTENVCATLDALKAIGADFEISGNSVLFHGFDAHGDVVIDCRDSKETLMLILPLVCCFEFVNATFIGNETLVDENLNSLIKLLSVQDIEFDYDGKMPFTVKGKYPSGECYAKSYLDISGLLLALPHNETDSMILVSNKDSSRVYPDMCADILREAKILTAFANGIYIIRGGQKYSLLETEIGGDFLVASNFVVANAISSNVRVSGLDATSPQPEKAIFEIIRKTQSSDCKAFSLDASDYIRLVPILAVYACSLNGTSRISGIKTDFYDCTDLIENTCNMINAVGGKAKAFTDAIEIEGVKKLKGGTIDADFDYKLVLAATTLATMCSEPVVIEHGDSITKRYPTFFEDFRRLGGIADIEF